MSLKKFKKRFFFFFFFLLIGSIYVTSVFAEVPIIKIGVPNGSAIIGSTLWNKSGTNLFPTTTLDDVVLRSNLSVGNKINATQICVDCDNTTVALEVNGDVIVRGEELRIDNTPFNISIINADAGALKIVENGIQYMTFDTTDGSEDIEIHRDFKMSGIGLQDYLQTVTATSLTWQGLDTGVISAYSYFTGDGDGTDSNTLNIFGVGTPDSVANREQLRLGWFSTSDFYAIFTEAQGTGNLKDLSIYTEGNANQLLLNTDGNNYMLKNLSVSDTINASKFEIPASTSAGLGAIYQDGVLIFHTVTTSSGPSLFLGENAGNLDALSNSANIGIGRDALGVINGGDFNTAVGGDDTLTSCTSCSRSNAYGWRSLSLSISGISNNAHGSETLRLARTSSNNNGFGDSALENLNDRSSNMSAFGHFAGWSITDDDNAGLFLGAWSGIDETEGYKLYIDTIDRGSLANGRAQSLIYGEFDDTAINQNITFNVGRMNVTGNITSENLFIPQDIFAHTNRTMLVAGANIWTNITFDQETTDIMYGISHTATDNTNETFTINQDGIYYVDYDFDLEDTSAGASDIDIAGRLIFVNGTEVVGSDFESGIEKNGVEKELSHSFLFKARAGDQFKFQFVADDADVQISTHGTFGDFPESASIVIKKERNL